MASKMAPGGVLRGKPLTVADEVNARHRDDNIDDMTAPSTLVLTAEIEIPRELEVLRGRRIDSGSGSSWRSW
jgi:hypothetical protein